MPNTVEKAAFSVEEAHNYIGTSRATLYRLFASGTIPSFNIGQRRLVRKEDLDKFLQERLVEASYQPGQGR